MHSMRRARNPDNPRSVAAQNKQSTQRFVPFASSANKLDVVADFVCEIFSFAKFPFGLEPKLFIPSNWPVVLFPDFPGALSDFFFVEFCQSAGSLFQLRCQGQYAPDRFPIAYPPREVAVFFCLLEKAGDRLLLIHRTLSIKLDDGDLNLFSGLDGLKLALAPGAGGHICELFAENPHWRERLTPALITRDPRGLSLEPAAMH